MKELLAKSRRPGQTQVTLRDHSTTALNVAEAMFGKQEVPTRLALAWLHFFKIVPDQSARFLTNLQFSSLFHDVGKANDGFQKAVENNESQSIYHERLSGLVLLSPSVKKWIDGHPLLDFDLALVSILGHHLRLHRDPEKEPLQMSGSTHFTFFADHLELMYLVSVATNRVGVPGAAPAQLGTNFWKFGDARAGVTDASLANEDLYSYLRAVDGRLKKDISRTRMLWALRAALMAVDAAASGLVRQNQPLEHWLKETFSSEGICDESYVEMAILGPRVKQLKAAGKWKDWSKFQDECAEPEKLGERGLLIAPCGSGKTLAAWRWVQSRVRERAARHVIFLYPTRATATEGFRDYVSWAPEADAALMHGTSEFDLDGMFENPSDSRHNKHFGSDPRLFALRYWPRRVFSATVDQFLAFLQYHYGSLCLLPVLVDSVVVIDEVHSFDANLFSALKAFLKEFNLPVLCMTASLTQVRRDALEKECGLKLYDDKPGDLSTIADAERYVVERVDRNQAKQEALAALKNKQRVIWVVNTVVRAQRLAMEFAPTALSQDKGMPLATPDNIRVYCYHSRFCLTHRVNRHREVVGALHPDCEPALVITTQVCEMSLDIDADLLITEQCPLTSFVQRAGRCNRARVARRPPSGRVLIYQPESQSPYEPEDLMGLSEAIDILATGKPISQTHLEKILAAVPSPPWRGDASVGFTKSGVFAAAREESLREIDGFTQPAILDDEVRKYLDAPKSARPGFIVPAPQASRRRPEPTEYPTLPPYLSIARSSDYHPALGLLDCSLLSQIGTR